MDINKAKRLSELWFLTQKHQNRYYHEKGGMHYRQILAFMIIDDLSKKSPLKAVKMNDIAAYFNISQAAISQMVKKAIENDWLEKIEYEEDKRSVYLRLSEKTRQQMEEKQNAMLEDMMQFMKFIGERDSDILIHILEKAVEYGTMKNHKEKEEK